jgi:hypothetical protein
MRFNPSRGGHAPGHLRYALIEALESAWNDGSPWWVGLKMEFIDPTNQVRWDQSSAVERADWLLGQLWDCIDGVPGQIYRDWGIRYAGTYARLARGLKREMHDFIGDPNASGPGFTGRLR